MKAIIPNMISANLHPLLLLALLFASTQALSQGNALSSRPDEPGTGPYPALKEADPTLPNQVVYRPADLDALGQMKLGVVAWGNGGCSFDGASSRFHLLELASHGYLVIAGGQILSGPSAPERKPLAEGEQQPRTSWTSLRQAVDWALTENAREDSMYFGRIDPAMVAYSGYSCGGVQVNHVAGDPRVKTLVMHNTGILNTPLPVDNPVTDMDLGKEALDAIHTPLIYILGGESDIAYANGMNDFNRISQVPAAAANIDRGHGGTFSDTNGGSAAQVAVKWLDWQLRGDRQAALYFIGPDCGLCRAPDWTLDRKFRGVVAP